MREDCSPRRTQTLARRKGETCAKPLLFAPASFNLAETTRMVEIARACRDRFPILFGGQFERLIREAGFEINYWTAVAPAHRYGPDWRTAGNALRQWSGPEVLVLVYPSMMAQPLIC